MTEFDLGKATDLQPLTLLKGTYFSFFKVKIKNTFFQTMFTSEWIIVSEQFGKPSFLVDILLVQSQQQYNRTLGEIWSIEAMKCLQAMKYFQS